MAYIEGNSGFDGDTLSSLEKKITVIKKMPPGDERAEQLETAERVRDALIFDDHNSRKKLKTDPIINECLAVLTVRKEEIAQMSAGDQKAAKLQTFDRIERILIALDRKGPISLAKQDEIMNLLKSLDNKI